MSSKTKGKRKLIIETDSEEKIIADSKTQKPPSNSNKETPCDKEIKLKEDRRVLNDNIKKEHNDCEITKYEVIYKYFNKETRKETYKDLLIALMNYYKEKRRAEPGFILPFEGFLDMFEKDTMKYKNFKKQHVFEALCKILLMYDYDNGELGRDKQFYISLEEFVKNPNKSSNIKERDDIINDDINVSSEGGVVDIFFKTNHSSNSETKCEWMCDCVEPLRREVKEQEYILIQNKYYSTEKSDIKNYDVTKIFAKAQTLYESKEKILPRIILMVNNRQSLSDKLTRSRDASKGLIDAIYGVYEIDKWFNLLLYDLLNSDNIEDFLEKRGTKSKIKPELAPRFHQMYFTESTIAYRNEGYKKFIWGAVPRSGKSYMIGDLISKRIENKIFHDVIIILGAKTETESQFIKMFCEFSNYNDYGIIKTSTGKMESIKNCNENLNKHKKRNIYIFSQDWFKNKLTEDSNIVFNFKKKAADFEDLFKKGNIVDVYFDEVHKGGSTDKSENILNAINSAGVTIDIFIMVTATFAKPNIKYKTNFIDTKEPKILEWSYEDQQIMKNIRNETKMDMMINSRTGIEREIIRKIFNYYKNIYQNEFLDIISNQYARHPELVLVQPFDKIKTIEETAFHIDKIFKSNLNCEACYEKQTLQELRDPKRIFFDYGRVEKLLQLIAGNFNPNTSVYGYLKTIGAPDYANKHSELWFLPDDDLYITPDTCREKGKCKQVKSGNSHNENKNDNKSSLPNIEALTRGLAFALMENKFFKEYYNVLIVHNTPVVFKNFENDNKIQYEEIFKDIGISTTINSKNLSESISEYETQTYHENKNLIILTGAKLRLGISLPCVDIGFNFDNIQSVDVNYQTMFRVLTERYNKPKKFGYYVDFNKERFIRFLYEYSNTYSNAKNIHNIKENISNLQGLLFLFNINGIGIDKLNERQELKLYNSLIEELKLNENGYKTYYSDFNNITNLFKKSLINVDISDLQNLKKLFDSNDKSKEKKSKIKVTIVEGEKVRPNITQVISSSNGHEDKESNETEVDEDVATMTIINIISDTLPRIIALIALFSNKDNFNCENLNECLENCLRKIEEFGNTCNCNIINASDILSCYLDSPFYRKNLVVLLKTIKVLLNKPDNKQLHNSANFIFNNIREMGKENEALIYSMKPEDIQEKIEKYLPVREDKKNKNGEVFTPVDLIRDMVENLPPSVWTNPSLKWLDPANGIGNFPMIVYNKLYERLPNSYKGENGEYSTEKGKKEHILKNMLYMIELDSTNVKISRRIFGKNANISCCSFLEDNWVKDFNGLDRFDIIIGNPPYNENGVGKGGGVLWKDFVFKSFKILNDKGYLVLIHPTGWRKPPGERASAGDVWVEFKKNNLIFLKISDKKIPNFPIVDYYVLQKTEKQNDTHVINEFEGHKFDGKINLYKHDFIPHFVNGEVFSILNKVINKSGEHFDIIRNQSFQPTKEDMKKSGIPHTYYYDTTSKDYLLVYKKYKKDIPEYINQNKIIMTYSNGKQKGLLYPKHYSKEMGSTSNTMYQLINSKDNVKNILLLLNSELINFILKITQYSEPPNYKNEFKILNMISKPNNTSFKTNNDIFKYYGLNSKEISLIESLIGGLNNTKERAAAKIKSFVTKKHREKKGKTQRKTNGGRKCTRKNMSHKKTRRTFFSLF